MHGLEKPNRRTVLKGLGAGALVAPGIVGTASANPEGLGKYHDVRRAEAEGYRPTPCVPGMGVHYINFDLIDSNLKVSQPEALVYSEEGDEYRFLGVEYLSPQEFTLFGHHAHFISELSLYGLHVWFFEENENGKHAERHSNVAADCTFIEE